MAARKSSLLPSLFARSRICLPKSLPKVSLRVQSPVAVSFGQLAAEALKPWPAVSKQWRRQDAGRNSGRGRKDRERTLDAVCSGLKTDSGLDATPSCRFSPKLSQMGTPLAFVGLLGNFVHKKQYLCKDYG